MAAIPARRATLVPLPTGQPATNAYEAFVNVISGVTGAPVEQRDETLRKIWKNASQNDRAKIEEAYPGTMEEYAGGRRRRKTKKSKRSHKRTYKRRHH